MQEHSLLIWVLWKVSRRCCHQIDSKRLSSTPVNGGDAAGTPWQRAFPSLFSCLFSALRACIMRPWLAWTGSNCNVFYCSVTVWILMPSVLDGLAWQSGSLREVSLFVLCMIWGSHSQSSLLQMMNGQIQVSVGKIRNPEVLVMLFTESILLQNTHSVTFSCFLHVYVVLVSQRIVYFSF